ncbi:MAG: hypothetical protein H6838_12505 [Planctomycetes bacterium]|nr:hypothetical protein [Planctomycetota bacterium]
METTQTILCDGARRDDLLAATLRPFASLPGVFVEEGPIATTVTVHKTASLDVVVIIVPDTCDLLVAAIDSRTGEEIASDRTEYYACGDATAPHDQLLRDLRRYLIAVTAGQVRVREHEERRFLPWLRPRTVRCVDVRRDGAWTQIVPFSEDFPWETS